MKYVSIDLETTGLNPDTCDIIEFSAVIEDTEKLLPIDELPVYHRYIKKDVYKGQPYALFMHSELFKKINNDSENLFSCLEHELIPGFINWLYENNLTNKINVAGKNFFAFDNLFLRQLPHYEDIKFYHRVIDPAILFLDIKTDNNLPDLKTCLDRSGIKETVSHTATEDAIQVIKLIRKYYNIPF